MNINERPEWADIKEKLIEMLCIKHPEMSRELFEFEYDGELAILFYNNEVFGQAFIPQSADTSSTSWQQSLNLN